MSIDVKNLQPSEAPKTEVPKKSLQETINEAKKDGKIDQKELQAIQETYNQEKELITLETQEKVKSLLKEVVNWMLKNWLSISRENIYTMTQILENASISFNKEELAVIVAENDFITISTDRNRLAVYKWWVLWSRLWYLENWATDKKQEYTFKSDSSFFDRNVWFNDNWDIALSENGKKDINVAKKEQEKPKITEKTQEKINKNEITVWNIDLKNSKDIMTLIWDSIHEFNLDKPIILKKWNEKVTIMYTKEFFQTNDKWSLMMFTISGNWFSSSWAERYDMYWNKYEWKSWNIASWQPSKKQETLVAKKDEATEAREKLVSNDYVIKKWDTLWKLAKINWTTVEKIMEANKWNKWIKSEKMIIAWAKIKLPWNSESAKA